MTWLPLVVLAGIGPVNVAILAADTPDSVALAERYRAARGVPAQHLCAVPAPDAEDIDLDTFRATVMEPLWACLGDHEDRISAVVIMRGMPLRVAIDGDRVSLAAAVMLWRSTLDGAPLLGQPPGQRVPCGAATCLGAGWRNPFQAGPFEPGWTAQAGGVEWRPVLATMLHGRTDADAERLLDSALAAEGQPPAGTVLLMRGADPARGTRDGELPDVADALTTLGVDAEVVPFDPALTGRALAGFVTGTAQLGETIEGNTFSPGALVDNLTSFGAVPLNFRPEGEQQVSIARWVAQGVVGVHGTTDEPLNNCFPARRFLVDYAAGDTLAEAYHRNLPFAYWRNLVLGDPLAAPYAVRPEIAIDRAATPWTVTAPDAAYLEVFVDGERVAFSRGAPISVCPPPGELLVVAEADDAHQTRGWRYEPDPPPCAPDPPDAELDMAAPDAGDAAPDAAQDPDAGPNVPDLSPRPDAADPDATHSATNSSSGCTQSIPAPIWLLLLVPRPRRRNPAPNSRCRPEISVSGTAN